MRFLIPDSFGITPATGGFKRLRGPVVEAHGSLAEALMGSRVATLIGDLPEDIYQAAKTRLESTGEYPLPDLTTRPVLVIGRGASSIGFEDRYAREKFWRMGINPGGGAVHPKGDDRHDEASGRHALLHDAFDVVLSADALYLHGAPFLKRYRGPVLCDEVRKHPGPGTMHPIRTVVARADVKMSLQWALWFLLRMRVKTVVLVGCDIETYTSEVAQSYRGRVEAVIRSCEEGGVSVFRDPASPFDVVPAWKAAA